MNGCNDEECHIAPSMSTLNSEILLSRHEHCPSLSLLHRAGGRSSRGFHRGRWRRRLSLPLKQRREQQSSCSGAAASVCINPAAASTEQHEQKQPDAWTWMPRAKEAGEGDSPMPRREFSHSDSRGNSRCATSIESSRGAQM